MGFGSRKELKTALEQRRDMPKCALQKDRSGCSEANGLEGVRPKAGSRIRNWSP